MTVAPPFLKRFRSTDQIIPILTSRYGAMITNRATDEPVELKRSDLALNLASVPSGAAISGAPVSSFAFYTDLWRISWSFVSLSDTATFAASLKVVNPMSPDELSTIYYTDSRRM